MSSVSRTPSGAANKMFRLIRASAEGMPKKRSRKTIGAGLRRSRRSDDTPRRKSSPRAARIVASNCRTTNGSRTSGSDARTVAAAASASVARDKMSRSLVPMARTHTTRPPSASHAESSGAPTPSARSGRFGAGRTVQEVKKASRKATAKRRPDANGTGCLHSRDHRQFVTETCLCR